MSQVKLVWVTPEAEKLVAFMARVSNPDNQDNPSYERLISYLIKHKHWSPFEMVSACIEITTTRDISRQIIRHRSFSFQEFSQRYAESTEFSWAEARLQDPVNRQNSLETDDRDLDKAWYCVQQLALSKAKEAYSWALSTGIAKEVARKVLPEGLTLTKMYMSGTLRSWMHYCQIRCGPETQKEHREVANKCLEILTEQCPTIFSARALENVTGIQN